MPLFKSRPEEPVAPPPDHNKTGFFGRRSHSPSESPSQASNSNSSTSGRNGFFSGSQARKSSSDSSLRRSGTKKSGGFFGLGGSGHHDISHDPSIMAARQKLAEAEELERAADRALAEAREGVRGAREHAKFLEHEAKEETLRAKAKQAEAKVVSKTARGLGRHG